MMRSSRIGFALTLALAALSAPAFGQDTSSKPKPPLDPNQRVCEDVTATGSRLGTKRICATRAEWAEMRKADRENVDQAQRSANIGCTVVSAHGGAPSC